jgi:hypothetical protein
VRDWALNMAVLRGAEGSLPARQDPRARRVGTGELEEGPERKDIYRREKVCELAVWAQGATEVDLQVINEHELALLRELFNEDADDPQLPKEMGSLYDL